jgi:hypothetical protein
MDNSTSHSAGDDWTFNNYQNLLSKLSKEARGIVAQLEASELIYYIRTEKKHDGKSGECHWQSDGADIWFDSNDKHAFGHELAGHGWQRDNAMRLGYSLSELKMMYEQNPEKFEVAPMIFQEIIKII